MNSKDQGDADLVALLREAGAIVHSDGNIFFTNAEKFLNAARLASAIPGEGADIDLGKLAVEFHAAVFACEEGAAQVEADTCVMINPPEFPKIPHGFDLTAEQAWDWGCLTGWLCATPPASPSEGGGEPHPEDIEGNLRAGRLEADALDAARWRMLPAFLEDHQIDYVRLLSDIDAVIQSQGAKP